MAKKLIITADDYGMSPATNSAVLDAVQKGLVTSVHVLPNMVTEEALKKLHSVIKENDLNCGIGVHFNHTDGPSVLQRDNSLVIAENNKFYFRPITEMRHTRINSYDLTLELRAQFDKIADIVGAKNIDAISSHFNIHYLDRNHLRIMKNLATTNKIPMRTTMLWRQKRRYKRYPGKFPMPIASNGFSLYRSVRSESTKKLLFTLVRRRRMQNIKETIRCKKIPIPSVTTGHWFGQPSPEALNWLIKQMERISRKNLSVEIFTHLANKIESLDTAYSSENRVEEYKVLTSPEVQNILGIMKKEDQIQLSSYRNALIK